MDDMEEKSSVVSTPRLTRSAVKQYRESNPTAAVFCELSLNSAKSSKDKPNMGPKTPKSTKKTKTTKTEQTKVETKTKQRKRKPPVNEEEIIQINPKDFNIQIEKFKTRGNSESKLQESTKIYVVDDVIIEESAEPFESSNPPLEVMKTQNFLKTVNQHFSEDVKTKSDLSEAEKKLKNVMAQHLGSNKQPSCLDGDNQKVSPPPTTIANVDEEKEKEMQSVEKITTSETELTKKSENTKTTTVDSTKYSPQSYDSNTIENSTTDDFQTDAFASELNATEECEMIDLETDRNIANESIHLPSKKSKKSTAKKISKWTVSNLCICSFVL